MLYVRVVVFRQFFVASADFVCADILCKNYMLHIVVRRFDVSHQFHVHVGCLTPVTCVA